MPRWLKIVLLVIAALFIFAHPAHAGALIHQVVNSATTFANSLGV